MPTDDAELLALVLLLDGDWDLICILMEQEGETHADLS